MTEHNLDDGNALALDTNPETSSQQTGSEQTKINPGAIRKSQTQGILNALSNAAGAQFDSVEAAVAWATRVGAQQNLGGTAQPMEKPKQARTSASNDLADQFQQLRSDLNRKDQQLRERDLDTDIQRVMGDKFDADLLDYALTKVRSNIQWNDDGTYAIVNTKGQERYANDGNPMTIAGLVDEVARGNPKLLKQNTQSSGSGLRPGSGNFAGAPNEIMPDYSRDPAAFNAWASKNGLGKNVGLKGIGVNVTNSMKK